MHGPPFITNEGLRQVIAGKRDLRMLRIFNRLTCRCNNSVTSKNQNS